MCCKISGKDRSRGKHGTQVSRLEAELGTIVEANTTLSTQLPATWLAMRFDGESREGL